MNKWLAIVLMFIFGLFTAISIIAIYQHGDIGETTLEDSGLLAVAALLINKFGNQSKT